ncbi:hypothetical protein P3X46_030667 [Hevea brasiliensis]|uniref:peptidylprolyl isomerase n=1 Tax=Hevea brasiliensis TaxID=3981 RepID=A0ABQ9KHZ4_HEVBR|nr:peptidyl-prolyl cis-trans isomerase FKBP53 isoform X2 [Hevea brasiliensis]KAJ9139979.1 hypothetical protein P3X46_030667 [Hevea brasiliensis]
MGFWGIEVKPGKPHPYHSDNVEGRLYVTQATLGLGSSRETTILQCSVGHKSPIFLCSLLPDRIESCSLNLEFKDELVAFSVIGPRSIHLSGYFVSDEGDHLRDEYESDSGEDIAETESEDSSEFDYGDDDDDDFIDDDEDIEMFAPSPVPNSGVVIEEIVDDDKPTNGNGQPKRSKKKNNKSNDHEDQNNSQQQIVIRGATDASVLESEDEDGFPVTASQKSEDVVQDLQAEVAVQKEKRGKEIKKKARDGNDDAAGKKRKVKSTEQYGQPIRKKKKEKQKEKGKEVDADEIDDNEKNDLSKDGIHHEEVKQQVSPDGNEHHQRVLNSDADSVHGEDASDKKKRKKKKKNKKKNQDSGKDMHKDQAVSAVGDEAKSSLGSQDKQSSGKSSQVRTFANGLVIEELAMGKPDGKRASPGCQVSVHYIGKLQKNGKIFDSNVGRAPFKFRLGVGQVIKGWDVGVNGMRIGDKRRLTIPPSMGYGDRGAGGKIPPNSWLVFDVELVNVR